MLCGSGSVLGFCYGVECGEGGIRNGGGRVCECKKSWGEKGDRVGAVTRGDGMEERVLKWM
ncbi:hypothetical protein [Bartonella queenslandensis]|uniref:hypothetical protein n=1 Tax=Bartonella queenslandensis TaxID=481138 RepID=UPI0002E81EBA|nr:hypothetical protein [Bartonella queenslandensis]